MTDGPLTGVRILDLTHVLSGPYATGQLALMGAEVIRTERPEGDDFVRHYGGTQAMKDAGLGAWFPSQNGGKLSILLDLKTAERPGQPARSRRDGGYHGRKFSSRCRGPSRRRP